MINTAVKKVESTETAKELVQDVFLKFYLRRDSLETLYSLKSYLLTALRNRVFDYYEKELRKQRYEKDAGGNLRIVTNNLQDEYEAKELNQLLQKKINELPAQCRKVFLLSREERLSHKEIAERLNISPNTVDQHIQKALRILRSSVGGMLMLIWLMKEM